MPSRPPVPCTQPGCTNTAGKSGRCDTHPRKAWANRTTSAASRGYGHTWRKLRAKRLKMDDHLCVPCGLDGVIRVAIAVDHVIPKSQGGGDTLDNLQSICKLCHDDKTGRESAEKRRGVL